VLNWLQRSGHAVCDREGKTQTSSKRSHRGRKMFATAGAEFGTVAS